MTFINEYISDADAEKYDLGSIDDKFVVGGTRARDWTIDRGRNMYLRMVARGREDIAHRSTWTFYWNGELLILELDGVATTGPVGGSQHGTKRLRSLAIPDYLKEKRDVIVADLVDALTAYKAAGVYSTATAYSLTLEL